MLNLFSYNEELLEEVYMTQLDGFVKKNDIHI
jgi:hypothetical protein